MSRRGEMGFLKDEFDIIFLRAASLFTYVMPALLGRHVPCVIPAYSLRVLGDRDETG